MSQLTEVGNVSEEKFIKRFREFQLARDVYYVVVIEDVKKQQIIGAATLVIEKKMIHECGSVLEKKNEERKMEFFLTENLMFSDWTH